MHLAYSEGERAEDGEDGLMHGAGQERQLGKLPQEWGVQLILQQQVSSESSPLCISRSSLSFVNLQHMAAAQVRVWWQACQSVQQQQASISAQAEGRIGFFEGAPDIQWPRRRSWWAPQQWR